MSRYSLSSVSSRSFLIFLALWLTHGIALAQNAGRSEGKEDCWKSAACVSAHLRIGETTTEEAELVLGKNYSVDRRTKVNEREGAVEVAIWSYPKSRGGFLGGIREGSTRLLRIAGGASAALGGSEVGGKILGARNQAARTYNEADSRVRGAETVTDELGGNRALASGGGAIRSLKLWFENGVLVSYDGNDS